MNIFKKLLNRRIDTRTEQVINFHGEQDGEPEQELKTMWLPILKSRQSVSCAYLAILSFDNTENYHPALCISSTTGKEIQLLNELAEPFMQLFNCNEPLDVIFLNPEQEIEIANVCRPFYDAT